MNYFNCRRVALAYSEEKLFLISNSGQTAVCPELHFHGRGRGGKQHLLPLAPCGSVRVSGRNPGMATTYKQIETERPRQREKSS